MHWKRWSQGDVGPDESAKQYFASLLKRKRAWVVIVGQGRGWFVLPFPCKGVVLDIMRTSEIPRFASQVEPGAGRQLQQQDQGGVSLWPLPRGGTVMPRAGAARSLLCCARTVMQVAPYSRGHLRDDNFNADLGEDDVDFVGELLDETDVVKVAGNDDGVGPFLGKNGDVAAELIRILRGTDPGRAGRPAAWVRRAGRWRSGPGG